MRETGQEIVDGISGQIVSLLTTYSAYYRGEYNNGDPDRVDDRMKELMERVQRLRTIREELENIFAGV